MLQTFASPKQLFAWQIRYELEQAQNPLSLQLSVFVGVMYPTQDLHLCAVGRSKISSYPRASGQKICSSHCTCLEKFPVLTSETVTQVVEVEGLEGVTLDSPESPSD